MPFYWIKRRPSVKGPPLAILPCFRTTQTVLTLRGHGGWIREAQARYLFKQFQAIKQTELGLDLSQQLWVYKEGNEMASAIQTLGCVPCPAPKHLYEAWERHHIVQTIFQERERRFGMCKSSSATHSSAFAIYTVHPLNIFRQSHIPLRYKSFKWKDAGDLDLDNVWTSTGMLINERCLLPAHVHAKSSYKNCANWTVFSKLSEDAQKTTEMQMCDCAAFWLGGSASWQASSDTGSLDEADSSEVFRQVALLLPRDFCSEPLSVTATGKETVKITWNVHMNAYHLFVLHLTRGDKLPSQGEFDCSPRLIRTELKHPSKSRHFLYT